MHETGKAAVRRAHDPAFMRHYFQGSGIDIGAGDDPLSNYAHFFPLMKSVVAWDRPQGDALTMNGVEDNSYDFVHSSHCLEHIDNPAQALARWIELVRPGGYVVITVPDEDLYEKGVWPSRYNPDHKVSFTIGKPRTSGEGHGEKTTNEPRLPRSMDLLELAMDVRSVASCERLVLIRDFYDDRRSSRDQTAEGMAECAIEIVLRKRQIPTAGALVRQAQQASAAEASLAACRQALALYPYRLDVYYQSMIQMVRWSMPFEQDGMWAQAVSRMPGNWSAKMHHFLYEIQAGRWTQGFQLREQYMKEKSWRRRTKVEPPQAVPNWTGQPLAGKSIVIWSEFGLGDEVFFFRFARILRDAGAARVSVVCQKPLRELFAASGQADVVVDIDQVDQLPEQDYWVYPHAILAWLPLTLETLPVSVPYLRTPGGVQAPEAIGQTPPGKLKVGIVTRGDPAHENDRARSLSSLARLDRVFDLENVAFFSLQKGEGADEAAQYAQKRVNFHDLGPQLETMEQTAAAISALDLVITVDTCVAHVAGALGKPVWLMLPNLCDWRWHYLREDSPWYPTMRLLRNAWRPDTRDWADVVERIRAGLLVKIAQSEQ